MVKLNRIMEYSDSSQNIRQSTRTSSVWKYFSIYDEENQTATCNHCNKVFSYKGTVTNLRKHYRNKHDIKIRSRPLNYREVSDENESDIEGKKVSPREHRRSSVLWQLFKVINDAGKIARCKMCYQTYSFSTLGNLKSHLRMKHKQEHAMLEKSGVIGQPHKKEDMPVKVHEKGSKGTRKKYGRRKKGSAAWKFFTKIDEEKLIASCNICGSKLSYYSSVSNLMKHMDKKHGLGGEMDVETSTDDTAETLNDDDDDLGSDDEDKPEKSRSMVWLYFKCLDPVLKISMCLICKKRLSFTTVSNLKRHLMKKHPNVKLPEENEDTQMIISSGGQLYEIETRDNGDEEEHLNDANEMDTVYLEDYIEDDEPIVTPERKRKKTNKVKPTKVYRKSNSSDEEITVTKSTSKDDSLNNFAAYVVSLLRQLPKNMSDQLQMDFIKEIMNARITLNQPVTVLPSNSYSITITDQEPSVTDATNDVVDDNK